MAVRRPQLSEGIWEACRRGGEIPVRPPEHLAQT